MSLVTNEVKKLNAIQLQEGDHDAAPEKFRNPEKERNDKIQQIDDSIKSVLKVIDDNKLKSNVDYIEEEKKVLQENPNIHSEDFTKGSSFCSKIQGTLYDKDGNKTYEGEVYDGVPHGVGESFWSSGKIQYSGE